MGQPVPVYRPTATKDLMAEKKSFRQVAWIAVRIIVPLGLIGYLLFRVDWRTIWPLLKQIPWWSVVISALLFILSQAVIAVRWHFLLRFQGSSLSFSHVLGLVFVGAFASNFLPTTIGGDVIKMAGAARGQKKRGVVVASVVADRLYNLAGMGFLLPLTFTLNGISLLGMGRYNSFFAVTLIGQSAWVKLRERIMHTWRDVRTWFLSPACILSALALSWLSIGLAFASFWVIALGLGISISYWQAAAASLLAYFVALIPLAINGLGIQEGSLTMLLVLQGASLEQATAAAFIIRLVTMGVSLLGGVRLLLGWQDLLRVRQSPKGSKEKGV
jgi:uncharacterized membrane protein YbhN (UPF0104 family)